MTDLASRLVAATSSEREHTAVVVHATYQPVGGPERTVMPPTYPIDGANRDPNASYLIAKRLVDGQQRDAVVIDQEPSQANRVEEALRDALYQTRLVLPIFEMRVATGLGEIRLTSLDFPHRYADAYLRDSLVDGVRFDNSPVGKRLRAATVADVRPLYEREPASLIFGAWDSHRKGRWPKFARMYSSAMYGLDPVTRRMRFTVASPCPRSEGSPASRWPASIVCDLAMRRPRLGISRGPRWRLSRSLEIASPSVVHRYGLGPGVISPRFTRRLVWSYREVLWTHSP